MVINKINIEWEANYGMNLFLALNVRISQDLAAETRQRLAFSRTGIYISFTSDMKKYGVSGPAVPL